MSAKDNDELEKLLRESGSLEEVPHDVALRFEATLEELLKDDQTRRRNKISTISFAFAAAFLGVLGFGALLNMDSTVVRSEVAQLLPSPSESKSTDILTSDEPIVSINEKIIELSSGLEYAEKRRVSEFPFAVTKSYGSLAGLRRDQQLCLSELGLSETISLIDNGLFQGSEVTAVWTYIGNESWVVSIISKDCQPIDEVILKN